MDPLSIATATGGWLWDKFGHEITTKARGALKEAWGRWSWHDREEKYKQRVVEFYGTTKVLGNPKPISLEQIYTDVFVMDKQSALRRLALEEIARTDRIHKHNPRQNLLALAKRKSRLYILGKPGAGKSTFLKIVLIECATGAIDKTPIFVSLKEWADSRLDLMDYIAREFDVCEFPDAKIFIERLLGSGAAVVLFDGLDEINQDHGTRNQTIRTLSNFSRKYYDSKIFVTCRIAATDYTFDQFEYVEIADFTEEQQEGFISRWYNDVVARERFLSAFSREENRGLRDLAKTPLLLALLCLAFDETLEFPRRRVDLYEEALAALMKKWDASRAIVRDEIYRRLSPFRKEQLLERVAAKYFTAGKIFFPKRDLIKAVDDYLRQLPEEEVADLNGEDVIRAIEAQHGILVERAHNIYAFSHLTIQEYFTAKHFVDSASGGGLSREVLAHATDDQWREVLLSIASLLDDASAFLDAIAETMAQHLKGVKNWTSLLARLDEQTGNLPWSAPATSDTTMRHRHSASATEEILDLTLGLAAQLAFIRGAEAPLRRARLLAIMLQATAPELGSADRESLAHLRDYLRTANLLIECLSLALVPARERYLDQILR